MRRAVSVFTSENTPKHPVFVLCLPSSKTDVCDFLCFHFLLGKIGTIFTPMAEITNIRHSPSSQVAQSRAAGCWLCLLWSIKFCWNTVIMYCLAAFVLQGWSWVAAAQTVWLTKPEIFTAYSLTEYLQGCPCLPIPAPPPDPSLGCCYKMSFRQQWKYLT